MFSKYNPKEYENLSGSITTAAHKIKNKMDVIDTLIPGIKSGDEKQFKAALSKYRKPIGRYTVDAFTGTPIAEFDRDNCHVVVRTANGEPCFSIWEKKEFGYIVHVIVHNVTADYTFDQIPF